MYIIHVYVTRSTLPYVGVLVCVPRPGVQTVRISTEWKKEIEAKNGASLAINLCF